MNPANATYPIEKGVYAMDRPSTMSFSTASRAGLSGEVGRIVRATTTAMAVATQSTIARCITLRFMTDLLRRMQYEACTARDHPLPLGEGRVRVSVFSELRSHPTRFAITRRKAWSQWSRTTFFEKWF